MNLFLGLKGARPQGLALDVRLWTVVLATAAAALFATMAGCSKSSPPGAGPAASGKQKYHCPMHPTYVSERPGDCPICNMKLVPIRSSKPGAKPRDGGSGDKFAHVKPGQFYCPMHPQVVSNTPGLCPDCNMKLVEKKDGVTGEAASAEHQMHTAVPGRVTISLSADKRQLIGLTLSKVERRPLVKNVRTAAVVQHDETRYYRIAPRFSGWVQESYANFTGVPVEKGQPLFTVYSPELFSTENEYLIAWRAVQQLAPDAPAAQRETAQALLRSAKLRLALWQIDEKEIRELEQRGSPSPEVLIRAPFSGHVLVKNVVNGQAFAAGETLYEIADLSHVWLRASVSEFELPLVHVGMDAVVNFPYLNKTISSEVTFVYPHIEPQTRRGQVRLDLDNPEHRLRPDMWAHIELRVDLGEKLTVPSSALIDTGQRYVGFVAGNEEHLEPREVKVGAKTDDYYEVLSGMQEGEQVVTRALFLVDSESQLKAAIAGMGGAGEHNH